MEKQKQFLRYAGDDSVPVAAWARRIDCGAQHGHASEERRNRTLPPSPRLLSDVRILKDLGGAIAEVFILVDLKSFVFSRRVWIMEVFILKGLKVLCFDTDLRGLGSVHSK